MNITGNYSYSYDRDCFKRKLMEVFKFTIHFLESNNLRWFVGGGTCIGTIRHRGLIPWDDDIDLFMPREDYNKLLLLQNKLNGTQFELLSWHNAHFPSPYAKMVDRNTTLWEIKYQPFLTGVFIDIFPMDLSNESENVIEKSLAKYNRYLNTYWSSISDYTIKDIFVLLSQKRLRFFGIGVASFFTRWFKNFYLKRLQEQDKKHNCKSGNYYVLYSACFAYKFEKEIFRREWFDDYVLMPFEGIDVRVPVGYDAYMKHVYGDYMKLPPEEKRITRHYHYYINLNERKTISDIISIKKCQRES